MGQRLAERLRAGDAIGRFSANKFGILLHACDVSGLRVVGERLLAAVRETHVETSFCRIPVTLSIGAVQIPAQAGTAEDAMAAALEALGDGRNRIQGDTVTIYSPDVRRDDARSENVAVAREVLEAIESGRMCLALQPIVETGSRAVGFHECLLRMRRQDGTIVSAGHFMPLAERLGLSRIVDRHVLELAVAELKADPELVVSLNVSGLTATDHEWLVMLDRLTAGRIALNRRLIVEITETAAIQDLDQSMSFVDNLHELGCRVAIDDFGAGYTSFRHLKCLAADIVKIDGNFVANLATSADDRVFVSKLAELAQHFGMETVAEWVADEDSAAFLDGIGITYLQGFPFGKPVLSKLAQAAIAPAGMDGAVHEAAADGVAVAENDQGRMAV